MSDEVPRRHPMVVQRYRVRYATRRMAPGSDDGGTAITRPVVKRQQRANIVMGTIVMVFHGDDGTVARPNAALARWVGAAFPANAFQTDDWIKVTL